MMMELIDTHAHLYDERFADDLPETIARAAEAGVGQIISMGDTMAASAQAVADAERYPALYAAVGIHPESAGIRRSSPSARSASTTTGKKTRSGVPYSADYSVRSLTSRARRSCLSASMTARHTEIPLLFSRNRARG